VELAGTWTASLTFDQGTADFDLLVRADNGEVRTMSDGETGREEVSFTGPAYLEVVAKEPGATGPYDLTLTE
jgi:hypothetical protein